MRTYPIGIIGLGAMGEACAERLLRSGVPIIVHNRSTAAVSRLEEQGAERASGIADLASRADVVLTILPEGRDVRAVFEGLGGVLEHARPDTLLIDCSTVEPELSRALAEAASQRRLGFADAGIGGLPPDATAGRLKFMYGSRLEDAPRVEDALAPLAAAFWRCGPPGSGMTTKLINNLLATTIHVANLETIVLAEHAGLDLQVLLQVLQATAADNRQLRERIPGELTDRENIPGFRVDLALKDVGLGSSLAAQLDVPLTVLSAGRSVLAYASEQGYGSRSISVLLRALREKVQAKVL